MHIIKYELKKLFNYRAYIFIFIACLIMGIFSSLRSIYSSEKNPKEYKAFFSYIKTLSDEQIEAYITDSLEDSFSGKGEYSPGTVYPLSEQYKQIREYPNYLETINEQCKNITSISIFADKNSFAYKNAQKTETAYNNIKNRYLPFDISEGLELALINTISDMLMLFLIFVSSVFIFTKDREIGIMNLLYSYPNGRVSLGISKIVVLLISSLIISGVFLISGLILGGVTYGLGDLSRPLQSVNGFIESNCNMCIWQYIIVAYIFKSISLFIFGLIISLICLISKNSIQIYGFSAIIIYIEYRLYSKYGILSEKEILHDINLISFIKPENYFSTYRNLNINEKPFNVLSITIIACFLLLIIITPLTITVFAKIRETEFKKISLEPFSNKSHKIHSKTYYALQKSLLHQRSVVIFFIWVIIICGYHSTFSKPASIVDMYYKAYTTNNSGIVNQETDHVISANEDHFKEIDIKAASGDLTMLERQELENERNRQEAFELFKTRCTAIRDGKYNARIFYDSGYKRAFGINGIQELQIMSLIILIVCVLTISPLIAYDNNLKITSIIFSTASGKGAYIKRNSIIAANICIISSIITFIPYFLNIIKYYGNQGLKSPIQSLTAFSNFPIPLNIWQFALLFFTFLTIGFVLLGQLMLIISYYCKSRYTSTLISLTIFIFPLTIIIISSKI